LYGQRIKQAFFLCKIVKKKLIDSKKINERSKEVHLELSFLTVRALPKASNSGFDCIEMRAG
jgi:hypothetical protein